VIIRGMRVSLDEIAAALGAHPGVAAAAVAMIHGTEEERALIAYVVPAAGAALSRASLVGKLRRRLPAHMVPGVYVVVPALPLTTNGKVDRAALPAPTAQNTLRSIGRLARAA
jgi:acyl-coenzyme A synthetase/AMP-(fatty) acid ligase